MDSVKLLDRHMTSIQRKIFSEGKYNDAGVWEEGKEELQEIKAVYMQFSSSDLKNYPQGFIEQGDLDLKTKEKLTTGDILVIEGQEWKVMRTLFDSYLADIKMYVLRQDK